MVWVKVDDRFDEHPKMAAVGPLGVALWVTGLAYCNRNLTDGFIPRSVAKTLVDWTQTDGEGKEWGISLTRIFDDTPAGTGFDLTSDIIIDSLLDAGIWERTRGGYLVHDFGDYQPTKSEIEEMTRQKVAAGRAGGRATAQARARTNGRAPAGAVPQAESKPEPEPEPEPEPVPESESKTTTIATSSNDALSKYDLTDPVDAWEYYLGKPPTDRQQDTYLASWIDSEGREATVELLMLAYQARTAGVREARDAVDWINRMVAERKLVRGEKAIAAATQRKAAITEQHREAEADPQLARLRRQAYDIGLAKGIDMTQPLPATVTELESWIADHELEGIE